MVCCTPMGNTSRPSPMPSAALPPLILLGPPGAGKSTQTAELATRTDACVWRFRDAAVTARARTPSEANILRRRRDPLGWPALGDELLSWLLAETLPRQDPLIVENFPGHVRHVPILLGALAADRAPPVAIEVNAPVATVLGRISGRQTCPRCSHRLTGDPHSPATPDRLRPRRCARCGEPLHTRIGDSVLVRHWRLARYYRRMPRIRNALMASGVSIYRVDGSYPVLDVHHRIRAIWQGSRDGAPCAGRSVDGSGQTPRLERIEPGASRRRSSSVL